MALALCRYICSAFHIPAVSLKHRFWVCHLLWHTLTVFLRSPIFLETSRLVAHIQFAVSSISSHPLPSFEWTLPLVVSLRYYDPYIFSIPIPTTGNTMLPHPVACGPFCINFRLSHKGETIGLFKQLPSFFL